MRAPTHTHTHARTHVFCAARVASYCGRYGSLWVGRKKGWGPSGVQEPGAGQPPGAGAQARAVSYTHLRAHETSAHL
eukprot:3427103-Alexandrium_andersonii.AAC.1